VKRWEERKQEEVLLEGRRQQELLEVRQLCGATQGVSCRKQKEGVTGSFGECVLRWGHILRWGHVLRK
jgi:hypothetical protein